MKPLQNIDRLIEKTAEYVLILSVLGMVLFGMLNIVLRWINQPVNWFEPFIRHLVLLCTFLGGILATGKKNHIGIDIVGKSLSKKYGSGLGRNIEQVISLASALTLLFLAWAGWHYVQIEAEYGKEHFLGIHSRYLAAIIPIGAVLIAYRFFFIFVSSFSSAGRTDL